MKNKIKNFILILGCVLVFIAGVIQGQSVTGMGMDKKISRECPQCLNGKKMINKHKESMIKLLEDGSFDEAKKNVLAHLDSKISFIEKEIEKYKSENDNDKVKRLEEKISKIKGTKEKINSAKSKEEIKNILDSEFKYRGKCKEKEIKKEQ
ncbi:hypothetical protein [Candidatus Arthromitus sp. SFB-rat-Yit]|uniref:hypothetical protein n=1 Tax=Candidatus Arthromitus sp. SFB-rat-Yit TaxID=1041504 RepID=UPI000227A575|nr:hypothetical protein [Candidatus Arthromitus sp. SFB-rat-Yit]BAK81617.1 hypothetical protein RATSFB_1055 [Candidatus Arthromitus sp. SFB-rat-Yit]